MCDGGIIFDESALIAAQAEKPPQLFDVCWHGPTNDRIDLAVIHLNTLIRDNVAKILDVLEAEVTLGILGK